MRPKTWDNEFLRKKLKSIIPKTQLHTDTFDMHKHTFM